MRMPIAILSSFLLTASAPVAYAHASLVQASPPGGSTMSIAPHEVSLTFSDRLEAAFSKLTVRDASGAEVSRGKVQISNNTMRVDLKTLSTGIYKVIWRAVSIDTHKTEGSFTFRVETP
jgi:methionine-rich copper-binding protein CopC